MGLLVNWSVSGLVGQSVVQLVRRLFGLSVGWSVGCSVGCSVVGWYVGLSAKHPQLCILDWKIVFFKQMV